MFQATENPILSHLIVDRLQRDTNGAVVAFVGSVRGYSSQGKRVLFVECEGDREVVERGLSKVGEEIRARWHLMDVALCHRLGRIGVGETILVAAIGAPHRQQAFEACQYAVDRAKEIVPLREVVES